MPYNFDFDQTNAILRCSLSGRVTDGLLRDFFRAGAGLALRVRPRAGVLDLSEVSAFEVSSHTLREQSRVPSVLHDASILRVVIAPSPETYGMMRMFELEGEHIRPDIHVVRTEREAWAILGVEKPPFEPL